MLGTITLLMVLSCFFAACEEDDHPVTVKSISFYLEEQALENGFPAFDANGPIMTRKEVNDKNPFILDKDPRKLYIICEVPSKINEAIRVKVASAPALYVEESDITSGKLLLVSPLPGTPGTPAGEYTITATADPGGISKKCTVVKK